MESGIILSLALGSASILTYGVAYFRRRRSLHALDGDSQQVALAPRNAEKWQRLISFFKFGAIGVAAVQAYFTGWEVLAQGLVHACFAHFIGETQRLAQQLLVGAAGFVYHLNFTPWTQIESIKWDNDIGQQSYGVQLVYTLNGRRKTVKLWIARERKAECARLLEKYMHANRPENLIAGDAE